MPSAAIQAWRLVQLGTLIRSVEHLQLDLITLLGPEASSDIADGTTITLSGDEVRQIADRVDQAYELTDEARALAEQLGDSLLHVTFDEVRDGAATELGDGILDPRRALLAARLLDIGTGWKALARALQESEAASAWGDTTLE